MDALTSAYQREMRRTRDAVGDAVKRHWRSLGSYNQADVPRFITAVTPLIAAGQRRAVGLSSAYSSRRLGIKPIGLATAGLTGAALRRGVGPEVVYRRPFIRVWAALKDGEPLEQAIDLGQHQAESNSLMDVALAMTAAYIAFAAAYNSSEGDDEADIVAWVRRADAGCCDFCQMLDGVHTGPNEPQPLHNRCGCTADPITRGAGAPSNFLTPGSSHGDVTIQEHGELGPVITQKGDNFTGPDDIGNAETATDE